MNYINKYIKFIILNIFEMSSIRYINLFIIFFILLLKFNTIVSTACCCTCKNSNFPCCPYTGKNCDGNCCVCDSPCSDNQAGCPA